MLQRFCKSEAGNFAMMFAIAFPIFLGAAGLATDVATLVTAKAKLQSSVDGAILAATRLKDTKLERRDVFTRFLEVHLSSTARWTNVKGDLEVENGLNFIRTKGAVSADVALNFIHLFGAKRTVTARAEAYEATDTLELAMVLDNTGSMGEARMKALREAATALADILENATSANREIKVALVPFVTAVNVKGTGYKEGWIDKDAHAPYHGANFEPKSQTKVYNHLDLFKHLNVSWKGCVEARPVPHNLDDTAPNSAKPETLFVPYFAPDNPGKAAKSPNSGSSWNNSYLEDTISKSEHGKQKEIVRYLAASVGRYIEEKGPRTTGPNYACPSPIEPLTSDFEKLRTAIGKMIHWEGSGTNVAEGLAWGMRVLSPGEPYSEGAPFKSQGVSKALVVFTDGENTVFGASGEPFNTSDYGAYGFLDSGRVGTANRTSALSKVNDWTQTMCTRLKDEGVQVFTVMLGADTEANRKLYSKCASSAANYFPTDDVSELKAAFQKIGNAVARLYLTQ